MNDEEVIDDVAEVDDAPVAEVTPQDRINDMIAAALQNDYVNANNQFNDILGDRVTDALDQEKVRIAAAIYGSEEESDESEVEEDDVDISDEEIEAELETDDGESEEESETTETEEISDEEED